MRCVPGVPGARSHGETLDALTSTLRGVIARRLEDEDPVHESALVGIQNLAVA